MSSTPSKFQEMYVVLSISHYILLCFWSHRIMSRIMLLVKANSSLFSYFRFPCLGNKLKLAASLFVWNWLSWQKVSDEKIQILMYWYWYCGEAPCLRYGGGDQADVRLNVGGHQAKMGERFQSEHLWNMSFYTSVLLMVFWNMISKAWRVLAWLLKTQKYDDICPDRY